MHFVKKILKGIIILTMVKRAYYLTKTEAKKDLGGIVDNSGKSSRQVQGVVSKTNSALVK